MFNIWKIKSTLNHDGNYNFGKWNTYAQYNSTQQTGVATLFSDNYIAKSQLVMPFDLGGAGFMKLSVGGEVWHERFQHAQNVAQNTLNADIDNQMRHRAISQTQSSLFLEDEYSINEYIGITGGVCYTYGSIFGSYATPRGYLVFKPFNFWTIKGGVATGYKVPVIKELSPGSTKSMDKVQIHAMGIQIYNQNLA